MKIMLQVTNLNHKYIYYFSKELIKISNVSQIQILTSSKKIGQKFHSLSNKIKIIEHSCDNYKNSEIENNSNLDFTKIKDFEIKNNISIWKIISSDRILGREFLSIEGYEFDKSEDYKFICKKTIQSFNQIDDILNLNKPDIFIAAFAQGNILVKIINLLCLNKEILYLKPDITRIKNYACFTRSENSFLEEVKTSYFNKNNIIDSSNEIYYELIKNFNTNYFDNNSPKLRIKKNNILQSAKNFFFDFMRVLKSSFINYLKDLKFKSLILKLSYNFKLLKNRNFYNENQKIFKKYLRSNQEIKNFVYFPLPVSPEYTSLECPIFEDTFYLIKIISMQLPSDYVLVVKEHPAFLNNLIRSSSFYKKINKLPNVMICPTHLKQTEMIEKSKLVLTVNGTAVWESILLSKPVITFDKCIHNVTELSEKFISIDNLHTQIINILKKNATISDQVRERKVKKFISSIMENSFELTFPEIAFYVDFEDEKKFQITGEELFEGFKNYLKKNEVLIF